MPRYAPKVPMAVVLAFSMIGAALERCEARPASAPPSADAVELAALAPPSSVSTAERLYGDAAFARGHRRRVPERVAAARLCLDPFTVVKPKGCRLGYRQYHVYTPAYVSAPQGVGVDPTVQSPLLPPFTALFWRANSGLQRATEALAP